MWLVHHGQVCFDECGLGLEFVKKHRKRGPMHQGEKTISKFHIILSMGMPLVLIHSSDIVMPMA